MLTHYCNTGIPEFSQYTRLQTYDSSRPIEKDFSQYILPEEYASLTAQRLYEGKPKKSGNIVEEIFEDKTEGLRTAIDSILAQIEERKKLRGNNLRAILRGECRCATELMQLEDRIKFSYAAGTGTGKLKANIEKELLNLEKERRFEEVSCWRDLVFLRKELLNTLREYQTAGRRQEMLSTK